MAMETEFPIPFADRNAQTGSNTTIDPAPQTGLSPGPSADGRRPSAGDVRRFALFSNQACRPALARIVCTYRLPPSALDSLALYRAK